MVSDKASSPRSPSMRAPLLGDASPPPTASLRTSHSDKLRAWLSVGPNAAKTPRSRAAEPAGDKNDAEPMSLGDQIAAEEQNYQRLLEWTERFDGKVATILTLVTAIMGGLAVVLPMVKVWTPTTVGLTGLAFAPLLCCVVAIQLGSHPRLEPIREEGVFMEPSLVFFGTSSALGLKSYRERVLRRSRQAYFLDLTAQNFINSVILTTKFAHLKWAYHFLWASYAVSVPVLLVLINFDDITQGQK